MKISKEHLEHLRTHIAPLDLPERRAAYASAGLSDVRYRWDLLWAAKLGPFVCGTLYKAGLDDSHIDTALRNIIPAVVRP